MHCRCLLLRHEDSSALPIHLGPAQMLLPHWDFPDALTTNPKLHSSSKLGQHFSPGLLNGNLHISLSLIDTCFRSSLLYYHLWPTSKLCNKQLLKNIFLPESSKMTVKEVLKRNKSKSLKWTYLLSTKKKKRKKKRKTTLVKHYSLFGILM